MNITWCKLSYMVETVTKTLKYSPPLELIDTVSLLQNRYVFVGEQKNYKSNKKQTQSMLHGNYY